MFKIHKQVLLKTLTGRTIVFDMAHSSTLRDLKQRIQDAEGVPSDEQRLLYNAKLLDDRWTPKDFEQQQGVVHLELKHAVRGGLHYCVVCHKPLSQYINWIDPFDQYVCTHPRCVKSNNGKKRKQAESKNSEENDDDDFEEYKQPKTAPKAPVNVPAATVPVTQSKRLRCKLCKGSLLANKGSFCSNCAAVREANVQDNKRAEEQRMLQQRQQASFKAAKKSRCAASLNNSNI